MSLREMLSDYWFAFQQELFPRLESELGPMGERYELFISVLELVRVEALLPYFRGQVGRPEEDRAGEPKTGNPPLSGPKNRQISRIARRVAEVGLAWVVLRRSESLRVLQAARNNRFCCTSVPEIVQADVVETGFLPRPAPEVQQTVLHLEQLYLEPGLEALVLGPLHAVGVRVDPLPKYPHRICRRRPLRHRSVSLGRSVLHVWPHFRLHGARRFAGISARSATVSFIAGKIRIAGKP